MKMKKSLKEILVEKSEAKDLARVNAEAEAKKITERETIERFTLFFGQKPERVEGNKAFFEDVIVTRNCGVGGGWSVGFICSKCGKNEVSRGTGADMETIGSLVKKGASECFHCSSKTREISISAEDKILEGLRDYILEHCNCD